MLNQGTHRATVAQLRRQVEALQTELTAREHELREVREAETATGWRSWKWLRQLPTLVTMLTAVGALFYTARGLSQNQAATSEQNRLAQSGQITDRFNAAVTNLGSQTMTIRLGGIYSLQRIMKDSPPDQPSIDQILTAFIRNTASAEPTSLPTDIQAALTVVARRDRSLQDDPIDLSHASLAHAEVFAGANLFLAHLGSVNLRDATLVGVNLYGADLSGADLSGADLSGANLSSADLSGANLSGANLEGAILDGTDLDSAILDGANLINARLAGTLFCHGQTPVDAGRGYLCKEL